MSNSIPGKVSSVWRMSNFVVSDTFMQFSATRLVMAKISFFADKETSLMTVLLATGSDKNQVKKISHTVAGIFLQVPMTKC